MQRSTIVRDIAAIAEVEKSFRYNYFIEHGELHFVFVFHDGTTQKQQDHAKVWIANYFQPLRFMNYKFIIPST